MVVAPWVALSVTSAFDSPTMDESAAQGDRISRPEATVHSDDAEPSTAIERHISLRLLVIASVLPFLAFLVLFVTVTRRHPP